MMAYLRLLLIAILTVASGATPLYCSDVQSPASGIVVTALTSRKSLHYNIVSLITVLS